MNTVLKYSAIRSISVTRFFYNKHFFFLILVFSFFTQYVFSQKKTGADSLRFKVLDSVLVSKWMHAPGTHYLPDVEGTKIYAGKKTNVVDLSDKAIGLPSNLARTALAKIPGLTIWEMDGAGTQLNAGTRGTDAHRSIEMNMRQNGYATNSDMFGYPEDHYTLPLQAVEEIQLVRGSAALQFGPQFGGMMNFVIKHVDDKPVAVESEQTAGGYNFYNSYNAIGGTKGKLHYYTYYDNRSGNGWRNNARFNYHAYYASIGYRFCKNADVTLQFSCMDYVQQIAGGLTDAQFAQSARQSFRARNFFQPLINIPALMFTSALSAATKLDITANTLFGQRNSVQFINTPNIPDTFNTTTGSYNKRQVDRDYYNSFTLEARLRHIYKIRSVSSVLSGGIRYSTELTKRRQKGQGTSGSNFDLSLLNPYLIDLRLHTTNYAFFAENIFQLTRRFSVTPGARLEVIDSRLNGVIVNGAVPSQYNGSRHFPLFGTGFQYQAGAATQLYANISQAYRPYLYASITPAAQVDKVNPDLKDSKGYDADFGYRGSYKNIIRFDVNAFYLYYGNKVGLITQSNTNGSTYLLSTNIGNSVAKGVEAFAELSLIKMIDPSSAGADVKIFSSVAYDHARYTSGVINKSGVNTSIKGNYVENAPEWINKAGLQADDKNFSVSIQYSYSSKSYNDALNTLSSSNGVTGLIPAWHVWDAAATYHFAKLYHISAGINNITDEKYFNRRITMYPGPGILPADGTTFYISFGVKM